MQANVLVRWACALLVFTATVNTARADEADERIEEALEITRSGHAHLSALVESRLSSCRLDDCDILDASVDFTDAPNQNLVVRSVDATSVTKDDQAMRR